MKKNIYYDKNIINVTRTYLPSLSKYVKYVERIFSSRWVTNNGPLVSELESRLKEFLGVKYIVLVSNGTLALQIAYKILELQRKVFTTPFSFVATTSSLVFNNHIPVFIDIESDTFLMDLNILENQITKTKIRAVVAVHVFGNPLDVERVDHLTKTYNLKVVYDASHCFGVEYKGNSILNYGDISTLSFHATKLFHTVEGGAIVTNGEELYNKAKLMTNFGIKGPDQIETLGINAKMNEFEAAMGLAVLDDINLILERREEIFYRYKKELSGYVEFQKLNPNITRYNYSYFPILLKSEDEVLCVMENLKANNIIPRRYFYPSLDTLEYLQNKKICKVSRNISSRILCLPIFPDLDKEMQIKTIEIIKKSVKR